MINKKEISKSIVCGVLWTTLSMIFGLLQLLLILASHFIVQESPPIHNQIILEGALLFFSTALVAALTMDYFFSKKRDYNKAIVGTLFVLYPIIILIVAVWLFSLCFGKLPEQVDIELISKGEYAVIAMSAIYAIVVKSMDFIDT